MRIDMAWLFAAVVAAVPATAVAEPEPLPPLLTVSTDGPQVFVRFARMRGRDGDWIGLAPVGSPATQYTAWQYTAGARAGRLAFDDLPAGEYVARAFFGSSSYRIRARSAPFRATGRQCPPDASIEAHQDGGRTFVRFAGFCGSPHDWIAVAQADSAPEQYVQWIYTSGAREGEHSFDGLPPGRYVARAFFDWGATHAYTVRAQSAPFTIAPPGCVCADDAPRAAR